MLPRLDTTADVRDALRHLRYPPDGDRGVATSNRACRFGLDEAALHTAAGEVLGVVQIESARAVEQVGEIAALDGVDVLFVGPRDLSHDLGVPGDFQAASYQAALERVRAAAQRHGKGCGLVVPDGAAASARQHEGWTFVAVGSDSTLLARAVATEVARARTAI
jgi:2-dehydro-3-deoxyglucarate aldolase/4-hydroxy-2-oxoheptanedioate aldolase